MIEYVGMGEMAWMILPLFALMLLTVMIPVVLFAIFLWKIHHHSVHLIDTNFVDEQREMGKRFITNVNSMMEAWIEDKKDKK